MRNLRYFTTTNIWLSLEDYHNAGLTSKQTKAIIEETPDPFSMHSRLTCRSAGVNGNWIVSTNAKRNKDIRYVVDLIEKRLESAILTMKEVQR